MLHHVDVIPIAQKVVAGLCVDSVSMVTIQVGLHIVTTHRQVILITTVLIVSDAAGTPASRPKNSTFFPPKRLRTFQPSTHSTRRLWMMIQLGRYGVFAGRIAMSNLCKQTDDQVLSAFQVEFDKHFD